MRNTQEKISTIWRRLNPFRWSKRIEFVAVRYGATAAIAVEQLLYARLLGPKFFGEYALTIQIVGFLLLVGSGSTAGYIYVYYKTEDKTIESIYLLGACLQYLLGAVVMTIFSGFLGSYVYISSILLLLQIPYFVTEPMLRVRNQFTLPAIGRASGSIATIAITLIVLAFTQGQQPILNLRFDLSTGLMLMLIGNFLGYGLYYGAIFKSRQIQLDSGILVELISKRKSSLLKYWQAIIAPSWLFVLSSIVFVAFTYVDRLFLEAHYPIPNLSVYSLAWLIAQSVLLLLNSLNIIAGVKIGEFQSQDPKQLIAVANRQLKHSMVAGVAAFAIAVLGAWILSRTLYQDYENLLLVTSVLALGYLVYGVVGSISMFLFFEKQFAKISIVYSIMLIISLAGNFLAVQYGLNYIYPVALSSFGLIVASALLLVLYQFSSNQYLRLGSADVNKE